jgi:NADPH:quinone reductase-like Zn-dependent oxidoreductase
MGHAVPLRDQGAWAAQHVLPVASIASKPPEVRWQVAGAIAVPSLTALQALDEALGVRPGETLVVHGGGGVTGRLVVQLAVDRGLRVIATAGPSSAAKVAGYGAMAVLDYHDANWAVRAIAETAGQGADAAVNAVPGGAATALRALRPGGRLATITGDPPRANGFAISNVYVRPDGDQLAEALQLVARGRLTIDVAVSEPLARAADAHDAVVSRRAGGAVVIEPDSP